MEPILNPWWLYLIAVADNCKFYLKVISFLCFMGVMINTKLENGNKENPDKEKEPEESKTAQTFFLVVAIGCFFVNIFIPSKETCYQMLIAKYVTPDNLVFFKGEAINLVDYIVKQVNALKN